MFSHLQEILRKYIVNFSGECVSESICLSGEVNERDSDA